MKSDQVLSDMEVVNRISQENLAGIGELVAGNNEISHAIEELAQMGESNNENINGMDEKLNQFRVD